MYVSVFIAIYSNWFVILEFFPDYLEEFYKCSK